MPTVQAWGATDMGRVRKNNEDNWLIDESLAIALVADGMGGAACGEVASALTVEQVQISLGTTDPSEDRETHLKHAIRDANRKVWERAKEQRECEGMGSTIVLASWSGSALIIANVGDSRAYLFRAGELKQISYDQNLGNELRRALGYSEEQVSKFAHRNVLTMAIGTTEEILVAVQQETLQDGDQVLLCSDGLSGPVTHQELTDFLASGTEGDELIQQMIAKALDAGGPDNITAILLRYAE